jgi:hypothetical protein
MLNFPANYRDVYAGYSVNQARARPFLYNRRHPNAIAIKPYPNKVPCDPTAGKLACRWWVAIAF